MSEKQSSPNFEVTANGSFEFVIPSHTNDWKKAQEVLVEAMKQHPAYTGRDTFGFMLALEEAFLNAIKHGNQQSPEKVATAVGHIGADRVWVSITDEGTGFDPTNLPDSTDPENIAKPSGRGVMLMCAFLSAVIYNERGNKVWLERTPGPEGDNEDEHDPAPIVISDEIPSFAIQPTSPNPNPIAAA